RREVECLPPGEVVGHVGVAEPGQSTPIPAHLEAGEVVLDVVVLVAVGRVAGLGLDAKAVGRCSLTNPGANILRFLGPFAGLGHYYTFCCLFDVLWGGRASWPALLVYVECGPVNLTAVNEKSWSEAEAVPGPDAGISSFQGLLGLGWPGRIRRGGF